MLVQHARLTDQVQAHVGQRQVFFQDRAVTAPLGIALTQDQCVVCQVQQVVEVLLSHYMYPTSSGI